MQNKFWKFLELQLHKIHNSNGLESCKCILEGAPGNKWGKCNCMKKIIVSEPKIVTAHLKYFPRIIDSWLHKFSWGGYYFLMPSPFSTSFPVTPHFPIPSPSCLSPIALPSLSPSCPVPSLPFPFVVPIPLTFSSLPPSLPSPKVPMAFICSPRVSLPSPPP